MTRQPKFRAKLLNAAKTGTETVYVLSLNPAKRTAEIAVYRDGDVQTVKSDRLSGFSAVTA